MKLVETDQGHVLASAIRMSFIFNINELLLFPLRLHLINTILCTHGMNTCTRDTSVFHNPFLVEF